MLKTRILTGLIGVALLASAACFYLTAGSPAARAADDPKLIRSKCILNHKTIFQGLDDYHSAHGTLPAAYSVDRAGKPLLSWRVHILPFMEQKPLFDRFHLDEPWDSPHNKALIGLMPAVYACPGQSRELARAGKTSFFTPRGPTTAFPGPEPVSHEQITDGRPSTVLIVEAADSAADYWTKPADWDVGRDPKSLFGRHDRGTTFSLADSSTHAIKPSIKPSDLKAILTSSGKEDVPPGF